MSLQEHMQIFTLMSESIRGVSQGRRLLHSPLRRLQWSSTDPSPAQQDPLPHPHTAIAAAIRRDLGEVLTGFPSSSPKTHQIYRKKGRILNLRRVISITLSVITFSLLTADYKVFFNHVLQRKPIIFTSKELNQPPLIFTPAINFVH